MVPLRKNIEVWYSKAQFKEDRGSTAPATLICGSSEEGDSRASNPPAIRRFGFGGLGFRV